MSCQFNYNGAIRSQSIAQVLVYALTLPVNVPCVFPSGILLKNIPVPRVLIYSDLFQKEEVNPLTLSSCGAVRNITELE